MLPEMIGIVCGRREERRYDLARISAVAKDQVGFAELGGGAVFVGVWICVDGD